MAATVYMDLFNLFLQKLDQRDKHQNSIILTPSGKI